MSASENAKSEPKKKRMRFVIVGSLLAIITIAGIFLFKKPAEIALPSEGKGGGYVLSENFGDDCEAARVAEADGAPTLKECVLVHYATTRQFDGATGVFLDAVRDKNARLNYGSTEVLVPLKTQGFMEGDEITLAWNQKARQDDEIFCQSGEFNNKGQCILAITTLKAIDGAAEADEKREFYTSLNSAIDKLSTSAEPDPTSAVLVYVHGYQTPFYSAVSIAAHLAVDLNYDPADPLRGLKADSDQESARFPLGHPVVFSWPTPVDDDIFGIAENYKPTRETAIENGEPFAEFLKDLFQNTNVTHVNIIAHSMGNIVFEKGVEKLIAEARPIVRPGQTVRILHMASDAERKSFRRMAGDIGTILGEEAGAKEFTSELYFSSTDTALLASQLTNQFVENDEGGNEVGITAILNEAGKLAKRASAALTVAYNATTECRAGQSHALCNQYILDKKLGYRSIDAGGFLWRSEYSHEYYRNSAAIVRDMSCSLRGIAPERNGGPRPLKFDRSYRNLGKSFWIYTSKKGDRSCALVRLSEKKTCDDLERAPGNLSCDSIKPEPKCEQPTPLVIDSYPKRGYELTETQKNSVLGYFNELATKEGCRISSIQLDGHADRWGSEEFNLELSQKRVDEVARLIEGLKLKAVIPDDASVSLQAFGEKYPTGDRADGVLNPTDRRVVISVVLTPA